MSAKKRVCFVSHNKNTQEYITKQLHKYLGDHVDVTGISLEELNKGEKIDDYDFYLTSSIDVCEKIFDEKFCKLNVLLADRALSTENIDKIFELKRGSKALLVGNTYQTALRGIELIRKIGIDYIDLIPYYPNCDISITAGIDTAITTGSPHLMPNNISKFIDLGVVGLDLSTFVELIHKLDLPSELMNKISQNYLREIYGLSLRQQMVAQDNYDIKKRFEIILNTVNEAIISVDKEGKIQLINNWAEILLSIVKSNFIGKTITSLISSDKIKNAISDGVLLDNEIIQIKGIDYVVNTTLINDIRNRLSGFVFSLKKVGEVQKIETKIRRELKDKYHIAKYYFRDIVGESREINNLITLAKKFAKTDFTVLIEGESGTGKELLAQAIHNHSNRSLGPFVAINLAALPENLVESELFGYEEGAFTGAKKSGKQGLFEDAHNGTIFLDEIGDASLEVQKKLLRVLEEREVRRVGGSSIIPINVRVIAATNKNLIELVDREEFRSDLYYRLCAISLLTPSLRDRGEDIVDLSINFCNRFFKRDNNIQLSDEVIDFFLSYKWPGNIRELENVVNYFSTMLVNDNYVTIEHLPIYLQKIYRKSINNISNEGIIAEKNSNKFSEVHMLASGFDKTEQLDLVIKILSEINVASTFDKGVGRNYLRSQLIRSGMDIKDYKLRKLLDTLSSLELIEQGVTKQGSKISELGVEFLKYIQLGE